MVGQKLVFWRNCNPKVVLDSLAEGLYDVNNDFNGENGEDYTSSDAIEHGCKSDLEYTKLCILDYIKDSEERVSVENIVNFFLKKLFEYADWYDYYTYEIMEHPTRGTIGVAVAWEWRD